jgi:hypothetical protein
MAIQKIEISNEAQGTKGMAKEIDASANKLILDTIQRTQYVKPIESAIRECVSNAVDSQSEKEKAFAILKGTAKVEDYFIQRDGEQYKASNWDPSYYDLARLNQSKNKVEVEYQQHEGSGFSDRVIIRDYGVGLGAKRLEGYFKIG